MTTLRELAATLAASCLVGAACSSPARDAAPTAVTRSGAAHEVAVTGFDYAFAMPDTVDAGRTAFSFTNRGKVEHEYNLVLLKRGATLAQFVDAQNRHESVAPYVDGPVGVLFASPGRTSASVLTTDLLPGRTYAVQCIFQNTDSAPTHRALGMFKAVVVRGGAPPSPPAVVVDTVVGTDYAYTRYPRTLTPGWHHFVFVNAGKQRHEVDVALLKPGVTLAQLLALGPRDDPTPLLDESLGVLHATAGTTPFGTLDFEVLPGREYVIACTFQDTPTAPPHFALGMAASLRATGTATGARTGVTTDTAAGTLTAPPSDYLYLWASSADSSGPDFLAVYDVRDRGAGDRYGALVTTLAVPGGGHRTHHTEHLMPADRQLFANDFGSGESFVFDLSTPAAPRLVRRFGNVGALMHPHSFWRLPSGNVLATFQMQHDSLGTAPGGLAELTPRGDVVRASSSDRAGVDRRVRLYSAAVLPAADRVVVTTTDMDHGDPTRALQLWRLSDLSLRATIDLPNGPRGDEGYLSAEPRVLRDGKTVLVSTFNCGLYLLGGVETDAPTARLVASFPRKEGTSCAVPVVAGRYYLITVPAWSAVVSLDVSDPARPREVSRVTFGPADVPHWIGIEPNHERVVVTGYQGMKTRVVLARFDERTGRLALDARFRAPGSAEPGVRMEGIAWPHGGRGAAVPHGAVFSRPE